MPRLLPKRGLLAPFAGSSFWFFFFGRHGRSSTRKAIRVALLIIRAHWLPAWGFSCTREWTLIFIFLRTRSSSCYRLPWPRPCSQPYLCRASIELFLFPVFGLGLCR